MADLELIYIQMFPKEGDPGWHAGQLPDGRRVHAAAIPCHPGELHWSGSVEDADACECGGAGACNLCLTRAEGGLVFTKVTGCYRSANSAVRALQHWAANPDAPPPPAPFNCRWTTMKAVLCDNVPGAPPMPLGTTDQHQPMLLPRDTDQPPERPSQGHFRRGLSGYDHHHNIWRDMMMKQITPESLDECSESGHPRQAWLILLNQMEEATTCPVCGQMPNFWEKSSGDDRVLPYDCISEVISETHMASHEVLINDDDDLSFSFQTSVFQDSEEWPKPGSTDLTRLPYPGDDAITLQWFREEWNQRDALGENEVLLDSYTKEPLTDETLRVLMAECHDEGFSYESSATDIVNATRGIEGEDDDDDC